MRLRRLLLIRGQKEAAKRILVLGLESLKPMQATQMTQILNVVKVARLDFFGAIPPKFEP